MARTDSATSDEVPGDPVALSAALLYARKSGDEYDDLLATLRGLDADRLLAALDGDGRKKAFWINVYNFYVQHLLEEDPGRYDNRRQFYGADHVRVAGRSLSLDGVEHGILRAGQSSIGLGYVKKPDFLLPEFVRAARVGTVDPRIHFALNCGAASCPPVAAYSADGIDGELDLAAESYLHSEVEYDPDAGRARVPRLLLWFRGDFGGRSGIYRILQDHGPVPRDARPTVKYRDYDWSLELGTYRDGWDENAET